MFSFRSVEISLGDDAQDLNWTEVDMLRRRPGAARGRWSSTLSG